MQFPWILSSCTIKKISIKLNYDWFGEKYDESYHEKHIYKLLVKVDAVEYFLSLN